MVVVARNVCRSIMINCARRRRMPGGEKSLSHAAGLAQDGDRSRAERVLHIALLSVQGTELALGSLEDLGELFAAVRLLFRRRSPPAGGGKTAHIVKPWFPSELTKTVR